MKRTILLALALCCAWLLVCAGAAAEADWPESEHPYADNTDQTWTYQHSEAADWLRVTFSEETQTETNYDTITIIDADGHETEYTGTDLSGKTLYLAGDSFSIHLETDGSVSKYGFSIVDIRGLTQAEYEAEFLIVYDVTTPPESEHPYTNAAGKTVIWHYQHPQAADWLSLVFDELTLVEEDHDYITITDSLGNATEYTGDELEGKRLYLPGDHFTIQLTADDTDEEYGFSLTTLVGMTQAEYEDRQNTVMGTCGENVTWKMDRRTSTLTVSGSGPMTDYAWQEDGDWWLSSPPYWDWACDDENESVSTEESRSMIRHIVIEAGVTSIGGGAFRDLDGLQDIVIPSTVTRIGAWAFDYSTAIQSITLPAGLTIIDDSTFSDCHALTSVNIPQSVTSIGPFAFYNTGIAEITIPANVESVGERAFYECHNLQNITVASANTHLKSVDGVLFTRDGKELIAYCPGRSAAAYRVPDGVELIRASAFSYSQALRSVTLPDSLLTIQNWAFGHTGLTEILLPPHVQCIEYNVFGGCDSLTTATLPLSLMEIGEAVFLDTPLAVVNYEGTVVDWVSFVNVGDHNSVLNNAEFYYNVHPYCDHVLAYRAAVPHTCTEDGTLAHWECTICGDQFLDQGGTQRAGDLAVPAAHSYVDQGITTAPTCSEPGIRTYICSQCSSSTEGHVMTEVVPATEAHNYVNGFCANLLRDGSVCGKAKPTREYSGNCGRNSSNIITLYLYPGQTLNYGAMYSDNVQWTLDSDGTLHVFGTGAMCNCITIARANNYGTVLGSFPAEPWYDYRSLIRRVVIDHGVTSIGSECFENCGSLETLELPDTLTTIGSYAFSGTSSLREIYYHGTASEWAAVGKSGLSTTDRTVYFLSTEAIQPDLVLPASLTTIESEAFKGLNVRYIQVPATVTSIAADAFDGDVALLVPEGSYAEEWARLHRIRYIAR